jgi:hypothetical protein
VQIGSFPASNTAAIPVGERAILLRPEAKKVSREKCTRSGLILAKFIGLLHGFRPADEDLSILSELLLRGAFHVFEYPLPTGELGMTVQRLETGVGKHLKEPRASRF